MSQENVETVRRAVETWNADDLDAFWLSSMPTWPQEFRDLGGSVLALGHIDLTARVTGIEFSQDVGEVFDLRAGKIVACTPIRYLGASAEAPSGCCFARTLQAV